MATLATESDVRTSPRGRKVELRSELIDTFDSLKPGQVAIMDEEFEAAGTDANAKAKVRQTIQKNWLNSKQGKAGNVLKVRFTPEGVAQVSINVTKTQAAKEAAKEAAKA